MMVSRSMIVMLQVHYGQVFTATKPYFLGFKK
jgi:hypothetical protein